MPLNQGLQDLLTKLLITLLIALDFDAQTAL